MKDFKVYQTSGMLNFLVSEASDVRKKEQTLSGDIVSFTADEQSPLKIVVDIDSTGWTGCEVTHRGRNLCSVNNSGEFIRIATIDIDPIPTGNYVFSAIAHSTDTDAPKCAIAFYNSASGQTVSANRLLERSVSNERHSVSFSINDTCDRLMLYASQSYPTGADDTAEFSDIQITIDGEDWQTYEPYSGTTIPIIFPAEVGTVTDGTLSINYDGSVTLDTGGQSYTLTSTSPIETLIGDNNIWADAGPVSVTYPI